MKRSFSKLLSCWESRAAVHQDACAENSGLDMVAVHRWFQRNSVPSKYWRALADGAARRNLNVTINDFFDAQNPRVDQDGHAVAACQPDARKAASRTQPAEPSEVRRVPVRREPWL